MLRTFKLATFSLAVLLFVVSLKAQAAQAEVVITEPQRASHYDRKITQTPRYTIPQQRAMQRAAERTARLETLKYYGLSNARPTWSATPFLAPTRQARIAALIARHPRPVVIIVKYEISKKSH